MLADWHDFFITGATCAATLTGLTTVGISIGLKTILQFPQLPNKALSSIILLLTTLLVSLLCLVPHEHLTGTGAGIFGCGLLGWGSVTWLDSGPLRHGPAQYRPLQWLNLALAQFALLPYVVAGGLLLAGREAAVFWLLPALLFSFCKTTLDAWVLLVEIHR